MKKVKFTTLSGRTLISMQPNYMKDSIEITEQQFDEFTTYIERTQISMGYRKKLDVSKMKLYAWIGEDEENTEDIGIKMANGPKGPFPLISSDISKIDTEFIHSMLKTQATLFGRPITLVSFEVKEKIKEIGIHNNIEDLKNPTIIKQDKDLQTQFLKMCDIATKSPEHDKTVFNKFREMMRERGYEI